MTDRSSPVVNVDDVEEEPCLRGSHYGGYDRPLTKFMKARGGKLGINLSRLPPGRAMCPFHHHQLEDEAFYILSGKGVLRYGEQMISIEAGDCISCPAGTGDGHQIANTGSEDLTYLAIGTNHPQEICVYPDSGKVMVRSLKRVGYLKEAAYFDAEPEIPNALASTEDGPQR